MAEKLDPEKRHSFVREGKTVFEWDQTLEEVNIYINLPPNVHSKQFYCKIQSKHVEVGIKGNPPYLNHDLTCAVKTDSSFWTLEDDIMHLTLQKRDKGQTWASPILGEGQLDPCSSDLEQKRLMLQRFQEEGTAPIQELLWVVSAMVDHILLACQEILPICYMLEFLQGAERDLGKKMMGKREIWGIGKKIREKKMRGERRMHVQCVREKVTGRESLNL